MSSIEEQLLINMAALNQNFKINKSKLSGILKASNNIDITVDSAIEPEDWKAINSENGDILKASEVTGSAKTVLGAFVLQYREEKECLEAEAQKKKEPPKELIDNLKDSGFEGLPSCDDSTENPTKDEESKKAREYIEKKRQEDLEKLEALERGEIEKPAPKTKALAKNSHSDSKALANIAAQYKYTETQIQAIKNTVAKGASDSEFEMLMYLANRYQLDPILKEIFYSQQLQTIMTSRDGYLKVAHRDSKFKGIQSMAVCENDDFELDSVNCTVSHKFGKGDRGKVIGAWAIVKKEGLDPIVAYAPYDEHVQQGSKAWKYKSAMCCKCAEAFALKRMFCITGLVTHEEFGIENVEIIDANFKEVVDQEATA